jgi:hypothetical protein
MKSHSLTCETTQGTSGAHTFWKIRPAHDATASSKETQANRDYGRTSKAWRRTVSVAQGQRRWVTLCRKGQSRDLPCALALRQRALAAAAILALAAALILRCRRLGETGLVSDRASFALRMDLPFSSKVMAEPASNLFSFLVKASILA